MSRWNAKGKSRRKPAKIKTPRGKVTVTCFAEFCSNSWQRRKPVPKIQAGSLFGMGLLCRDCQKAFPMLLDNNAIFQWL